MLAQEEARRMGHDFVGTEQILLVLGLDLAELRRYVLEILADWYKSAGTEDPSNMHAFGCLGRLLFFLEKYSEAS